jgi:polygalacturonase
MSPRLFPATSACLLLLVLTVRGATLPVFNALDYGAVPDGRTKNTAAFARAVAACAAGGGGTLVVPAGKYLTGSIQLESNLTLQLEAGAELLYSGDPADSPIVSARWECTNVFTHAPLLYANGKQNIAITGRGTLNGQGWNWWWRSGRGTPPPGVDPAVARDEWRRIYARVEAGEKLAAADFKLAAEFLRPSLVGLYNCRNILVEDVTLFKSPMWMLHPVYSDDIVIRGVRFVSADPDGQPSAEDIGPNGDGIDVDSCRNVRISDCFFNTSDDCIVIKSGRDADGLRTARPTEYVTVTNCVMYKGHGAVVIGSETSGDIRNVTASNIVSKGTDCGVRIKSMRGRGGVLENFRFDNWVIEDAQKQAFEITMLYAPSEPEAVSARTPRFRNMAFSNITVINAQQVASIQGLPERSIVQLRFSDINATGQKGFLADHVADLELHNVRVDARDGGAFVFDQVQGLVLDDATTRDPSKNAPVIRLKDSDGIWLHATRAAAGTHTFLEFEGAKPKDFKLTDSDLSAAATPMTPASL